MNTICSKIQVFPFWWFSGEFWNFHILSPDDCIYVYRTAAGPRVFPCLGLKIWHPRVTRIQGLHSELCTPRTTHQKNEFAEDVLRSIYIYIPLNQYFIIDYSSSWPNVSLACHHVTSPGGENHRGRGAWGAWPWASRREPESSGSYEPLFISCICTYLVNMWIDNLYKCGSVQYLMDFCRKKDTYMFGCVWCTQLVEDYPWWLAQKKSLLR